MYGNNYDIIESVIYRIFTESLRAEILSMSNVLDIYK